MGRAEHALLGLPKLHRFASGKTHRLLVFVRQVREEQQLADIVQQAGDEALVGQLVVHAGALLAIVAIGVSSTMGTSKEIQLRAGESASLGAYTLTFVTAERVSEPHRESIRARMDVTKNGRPLGSLYPSMNQYENQREPIGTPAVRTSLTEDLYLSIHNIDPDSGTVGLLVLVNPMVGWIWIATAVMALGGLLALVPSWRGARASVTATVPVANPEGSH